MEPMNTLTFTAPAATAPAPAVAASSPSAPFRIAAGAVLALAAGQGRAVEVIEGRLWVTAEGDGADHFVGPGGRHPLGQARRVVLENLGSVPALLRLTRAP